GPSRPRGLVAANAMAPAGGGGTASVAPIDARRRVCAPTGRRSGDGRRGTPAGCVRPRTGRVPRMAAPGGTGPIGPFPPGVDTEEAREAYDKMRRRLLWTMPSGLYVVGSRSGEQRNLMTLNWATQVSFEPKLLGIGVEKTALTHKLISESGVFTLCTISREDRAIVRKFTKPVEYD